MKDKLDLDFTIERLENKEKTFRLFDFDSSYIESADECNQIVEWLKELKTLREEGRIHPSVINIQKTTSSETFPRYEYDLDGNIHSITITNGNEFKSKPDQDRCGNFVYMGNVKFWKNQTVKEAIDEYYKSINNTPTFGNVVTVNSNTAYVYLNDWEKM